MIGAGSTWVPTAVATRDRVVMLLEREQRLTPTDLNLAHSIAVLSFWSAHRARDPIDAAKWLRRAVANWAMVLESPDYWRQWVEQRSVTYQELVSEEARQVAHRAVAELLTRALAEYDRRRVTLPPDLPTELTYHLEANAIRSLREAGGLSVGNLAGDRVVCGPLMLRQLGLQVRFSQFVGELQGLGALPPASDRPSRRSSISLDRSPVRLLMQYFSELGPALVLVERGDAAGALAMLNEPRCPDCRGYRGSAGLRASARFSLPTVCSGDCARFPERNPAYAGLTDASDQLFRDAVALTAHAHLALAELRVKTDPPAIPEAAQHWREGLEAATVIDGKAEYCESLAKSAVSRVAALRQHRKLDDAISLLTTVRAVVEDERLAAQLAELLTDRGVKAGNEDRFADAIADLRRSFQLNPRIWRTQRNLVVALRAEACQRFKAGHTAEARPLLEEAVQVLETALAVQGQDEETRRMLFEARVELAAAGGRPAGLPDLAGIPAGASPLECLEALLAVLAGDFPGQAPTKQEVRGDTSPASLGQRLRGFVSSLFRRAGRRPASDTAASYANSDIRALLQAGSLKYRQLGETTYALPFRSGSIRLTVQLQQKEDVVEVSAPLQLGSLDEAEALYSVLRGTYSADFFRLCRNDGGEFSLSAAFPLGVLTPASLEAIVRRAFGLADGPEGRLSSPALFATHVRLVEIALGLGSEADTEGAIRLLPRLCRNRRIACRQLGPREFGLTCGENKLIVRAVCTDDVVSFIACMGDMRPGKGNVRFYRRMAEVNRAMKVCKVALDSDDDPAFMYELPRLDDGNFRRMLERLETYAMRYGRELYALR